MLGNQVIEGLGISSIIRADSHTNFFSVYVYHPQNPVALNNSPSMKLASFPSISATPHSIHAAVVCFPSHTGVHSAFMQCAGALVLCRSLSYPSFSETWIKKSNICTNKKKKNIIKAYLPTLYLQWGWRNLMLNYQNLTGKTNYATFLQNYSITTVIQLHLCGLLSSDWQNLMNDLTVIC